jgi:hypothetical protein
MTIERRVEVLGLTVKHKKLPIGTNQVLRNKFTASESVYEDIIVESPDSLIHRSGYWTKPKKGHLLVAATTDVRYADDALNQVDIERGILPGMRVVYRWTPSEKPQPASQT